MTDLFGLAQQTPRTNEHKEAAARDLSAALDAVRTYATQTGNPL